MEDLKQLQNLKILCVEDDEFALQNLVEFLRYSCKNVYSCLNPQKALQMIEEKKPDIIISDIKMPQMNGIELLTDPPRYQNDSHVRLFRTGDLYLRHRAESGQLFAQTF